MSDKVKLRQICHSRSGDKGSDVNVGLAVYNPDHYDWVRQHVTEQAVADHFAAFPNIVVKRFEVPRLTALNFVVRNGLVGGVSRTLMMDGHGKTFSSMLLEMEIAAPPQHSLAGGAQS